MTPTSDPVDTTEAVADALCRLPKGSSYMEAARGAIAADRKVLADAGHAIVRVSDLRRHLTERHDPCGDRGVDWPCDVAEALGAQSNE